MKHWTLEDLPWHLFDRNKVDPELLRVVKAAAMVERNGSDYAVYLSNVFADDPLFRTAAIQWGEEEVQHGMALGRWAEMADPEFRFDERFRRFIEGYRLPLDARTSVRGSRAGELIARCVVEVGTSSFYSALAEASGEPVLKAICERIANDELHHYKLFYSYMRRYQAKDRLNLVRRLMVAFGRIFESEDDELPYAYYAANGGDEPYVRRRSARHYISRAYPLYRRNHVERGMGLTLNAVGLSPNGWLNAILARVAYGFLRNRGARLARAA